MTGGTRLGYRGAGSLVLIMAVAAAGLAVNASFSRSLADQRARMANGPQLALESVGFARIPVGRGVHSEGLLFATTRFDTNEQGLRVVDVRDPSQPVEVAFLEMPGKTMDIAKEAGHVFVAAGDALRIVDVSDPLRPRELSGLPDIPDAQRVIVHDGFAYVMSDDIIGPDSVMIADVRDPAQAQTIATLSAADWAMPGDDRPVHLGWMERIGDTLLVWMTQDWQQDFQMVALDISAPPDVAVLGANIPVPLGICCAADRYLYAKERVYDLKDPLAPAVVEGARPFPAVFSGPAKAMATRRGVFASTGIRRITAMRAHDVDGAGEIAHWDAAWDQIGDFLGILDVAGDLVFVFGWGDTGMGLQVLRVVGLEEGSEPSDQAPAPTTEAPVEVTPSLPLGLPDTGRSAGFGVIP